MAPTGGFRASFRKLIKKLEAAGKVKPGLTFHGLRHTVGAELAEAGESEDTIKAMLGNASNVSVAVYVRSATRQKALKRGVAVLDACGAASAALQV